MADETPGEEMPEVNYQRLRGTLEAEGLIGGESQAVHAFHAVEGQTLTVQLFSDGNKADFSLSHGADYNFAEGVELGAPGETKGGRTMSGRVPKTGLYFVGVVAEVGEVPNFRLRVKLE